MTHAPPELVRSCQLIGARVPLWTQGAGGNVSVKDGDKLWIKASGARLDQVSAEKGVACLDLKRFRAAAITSEETYAEALLACSETGKPSMESGFHAVLPGSWVAHFHALAALLMVHESQTDPGRFSRWLKAQGYDLVFLAPVRPGWLLSRAIEPLRNHAAIALENHGVILQGDDGGEALLRWEAFEREFWNEWGYSLKRPEGATPLKVYFPDTAVFIDRIRNVLEPAGSGGYHLAPAAISVDRDAAELWHATQILYAACPALAELPPEIASVVAQLPTEKVRTGQAS